MAQICVNAEEADGARTWGERALDLAREIGDEETAADAQRTIATAECVSRPGAVAALWRAASTRRSRADDEDKAIVMVNLVWLATQNRAYRLASRRHLAPALEFTGDHGLELFRSYLLAYKAQIELAEGDWWLGRGDGCDGHA